MANVIRTLKTVRPHIPLIKFPLRRQIVPGKPTTTDVQAGNAAVAMTASAPTPLKPVGATPRGSGIDFKELPAKYRRRPIEKDEIDYIERGGPV